MFTMWQALGEFPGEQKRQDPYNYKAQSLVISHAQNTIFFTQYHTSHQIGHAHAWFTYKVKMLSAVGDKAPGEL